MGKVVEKKGAWSEEEDEKLLSIIADLESQGLPVKWCVVSKRFPSRSPKQCRERYVYNLDPNISKEPWTTEEDALLIYAQQQLGNAWARIAACLPGRTENSTKTRFKSIVRAQRRTWKPEEDQKLLELQASIGSRWEEIAAKLPGRTKNAVRTRYRALKGDCVDDSARPGSPSQAILFDEDELAAVSRAFSARMAALASASGVSNIEGMVAPASPDDGLTNLETPKGLLKKHRSFTDVRQQPMSPIASSRPKRARAPKSFSLCVSSDDDDEDFEADDDESEDYAGIQKKKAKANSKKSTATKTQKSFAAVSIEPIAYQYTEQQQQVPFADKPKPMVANAAPEDVTFSFDDVWKAMADSQNQAHPYIQGKLDAKRMSLDPIPFSEVSDLFAQWPLNWDAPLTTTASNTSTLPNSDPTYLSANAAAVAAPATLFPLDAIVSTEIAADAVDMFAPIR